MNAAIRVLLVDDERSFLDLSKLMFEKDESVQLDCAESAHQAFAMLEQEEYDVIVADYSMPVMNGLEFLKELKAQEDNTPFILFTGKGRDEVAREALSGGADFYIQKGTDLRAQFAELTMMVRKLAEHRKMERFDRRELIFSELIKEVDIIGFVAFDSQTMITIWNPGAERITGLKHEEVIGRSAAQLLQNSGSPGSSEYLEKVLLGDQLSIQDVAYDIPGTNRRGHFKAFTAPVLGQDGSASGGFAILVSTSDLKLAEEALQVSEERYRTLFDNAGDALFIHSTDGNFMDVNSVACESLGYTREELLHLSPGDIDDEESAALVESRMKEILEKGYGSYEAVHVRKNGVTFPVEMNIRLISLEGKPVFLTVARDVSERRRSEEALRRVNDKLRLLDSITRHDLVNLLVVLTGYLDMAARNCGPGRAEEYVGRAQEASRAIFDQLEFARDYQKAGTIEPEWISADVALDSVLASSDFEGISIDSRLEGLELWADPMLEKVFVNLIDNARRHGGKVTTITFYWEHLGEGLKLVAEDDGVGIPDDEKEKIFERGWGKNTGLGLFLIREILGMTGYTIRETGVPGKGARFEIFVPKGEFRFAEPQK
jgi:PAS domain S-box-containing protein